MVRDCGLRRLHGALSRFALRARLRLAPVRGRGLRVETRGGFVRDDAEPVDFLARESPHERCRVRVREPRGFATALAQDRPALFSQLAHAISFSGARVLYLIRV